MIEAIINGLALAQTPYTEAIAACLQHLDQAQDSPIALTTAPIVGYMHHTDESQLYHVATTIAGDAPTTQAATIASAYCIALTLNGVHVPDYVPRIMTFCDGLSDDFDLALLRIGHVLGWVDETAALHHIGTSDRPANVIAGALYAMLRHEDDYTACITLAATHSAATAAIAGALMGARLGTVDALPAHDPVDLAAFGF
jgi:ADP-ribosylglycohydrolase